MSEPLGVDLPLGEGWERVHRDLTSRLGFGDGITEPMADNDTIVEWFERVSMDASEHHECPIVCERCGERLADTLCEHCHGSGGNNAMIQASGAYSECEWCAGAGKVHPGCAEQTYAELTDRAERAEADLADEKRRHGELRAGLADFYEHNADLVSEYWRIKVRALLDTATEEAQGAP